MNILSKKNFIFAGAFFPLLLSCAEYLVPYEYDNMLQSVKSQGYGVISQSTALVSTNSWNIAGTSRRYRCLSIPKISCSNATINLYANVSELVLTKPDAVIANQRAVPVMIYDIRYEDAGANWNLCGAAVGGTTYDDVTYVNGQITYVPNQYSDTYIYFTDLGIINSTAYMTMTYNQVCQ